VSGIKFVLYSFCAAIKSASVASDTIYKFVEFIVTCKESGNLISSIFEVEVLSELCVLVEHEIISTDIKVAKITVVLIVFIFFSSTPNDRGYGHPAVCGSIRCRETTK